MKRLLFFLFLFFLVSISLFATEYTDSVYLSKYRFGVYTDYQINYHYAEFKSIPGIPNCCPKFENGKGTAYSFGLLFEKSILKFLSLGVRTGFESLGGLFSSDEKIYLTIDSKAVNGIIRHDMQTYLNVFDFEPQVIFHPLMNLNIYTGFASNIITSATFEQSEHLISPDNGTFENHQRVRNLVKGKIPNVYLFRLSLFGILSYDFPLNEDKNLFVSPEIGYWLGLTKIAKNIVWSADALKLGVAFKYTPLLSKRTEIKELFKKIEKSDTVSIASNLVKEITFRAGKKDYQKSSVISGSQRFTTEIISKTDTLIYPKKSEISCKINAFSVLDDSSEVQLNKIKVEEFLSTRMIPLLNYVFFEYNNSNIPSRYNILKKNETPAFELQPLFNETAVSAYLRLLNIVGKRMNEYPDANITITGCNSDEGDEKSNSDLSARRADAIYSYLVNIWGIEPVRIERKSRNLPEKPSSVGKDDGIAENRRAEIKSDNPEILAPLILSDTLHQVTPAVIRFHQSVSGVSQSGSWKISVKHNEMIIKEFAGSGKVPEFIDWRIGDDRKRIRILADPLIYVLEFKDSTGEFCKFENKINVETKTIRKKRELQSEDKRIDQYSLILFNFDQRTLDKEKLNTIDYIKENISDSSIVKIEGFTDRIGERDYNYLLSVDRAKSVGKAISIGKITTKGYGNSILLYNNTLPEGRFYCRTVNVSVETPIESK